MSRRDFEDDGEDYGPGNYPSLPPDPNHGSRINWRVALPVAALVLAGIGAYNHPDNVRDGVVAVSNKLPGSTDYTAVPRSEATALAVPKATVTETIRPTATATVTVRPPQPTKSALPSPHEALPPASKPKVPRVMWILEENKGYKQVMNAKYAPYLMSLAKKYGYVKTMHAETHPSLGNYLDLSTGVNTKVRDDKDPSAHKITNNNIYRQLGSNWSALMEGMPKNCAQQDGGDAYVVRHNPPAYMASAKDRAACRAQDRPLKLPLASGALSKRFNLVVPNKDHDMHDGTVKQGDAWLRKFLGDPKNPAPGTVFASQEYKDGMAVFVTWDEDDKHSKQVIPTLVISKNTSKVVSTQDYSHYDILAATEDVLGLPLLGAQKGGAPFVRTHDGHSKFAREFGLTKISKP